MKAKKNSGFTIMEALLTIAIIAILGGAFFKLLKPNLNFFRRAQARQQATLEARKCMETVQRFVSNGRPSTVVVETPTGHPPNSRIQFSSVDGSAATISWEPPNQVHLIHTAPPPGTVTDSIIGSNVTGIMFTLDNRDPAIVNVSLQIDMPLNPHRDPDNVFTFIQPNQQMRMSASQ